MSPTKNQKIPGLQAKLMIGLGLLGIALASAPPVASQWLYATETTVDATGTTISPRDIVSDPGSGTVYASIVAALPETTGINAIDRIDSTTLFTSRIAVELPGPVFAMRQDVVRTDGGSFAIQLDGGAEGIPLHAGIDAVGLDASFDLLLSFDTPIEIAGLIVGDEDLVAFDGATFSLFFDGSAESIDEALDLDGAHYDIARDELLLSFDGAGQVGGVEFAREDILRFDRAASSWALDLDGSMRDPAFAGTNLVAVPEPGLALGLLVGTLTLVTRRSSRAPRGSRTNSGTRP